MPALVMAEVEALRVGALEPLHPLAQIRLRCLQKEMDVIAHQAVAQTFPTKLGANIAEDAQIATAVLVIDEQVSAVDSARGYVVHTVGQVGAWFPRHVCNNPAPLRRAPPPEGECEEGVRGLTPRVVSRGSRALLATIIRPYGRSEEENFPHSAR